MEATFLVLCNYELYVSENLYDKYYKKIVGDQRAIRPETYGMVNAITGV